GGTRAPAPARLVTRRHVRPSVATTGESPLRGRVLPVGGIQEKVLAAKRAGIETVLLPKRNAKDLDDVPEEVRRSLRIGFVETVDELLEQVLETATAQRHDPGPSAARGQGAAAASLRLEGSHIRQ